MSEKPRTVAVLHGLNPKGQVRSLATADAGRLVAAVDGWNVPAAKAGNPPTSHGELAIWRDGELVGGKPVDLGTTFGDWVALSPDGSLAAVAADDGTLRIFDTATGRQVRTIKPQTGAITVAFAPDGTLASGANTGIVDLWNAKTGRKIGHDVLTAPAPVASIAFAPDGRTFTTSGGSSGHAKVWATSSLQQLGTDFPGGDGYWGNVGYTPDGRSLIVVFNDGSAYRWPITAQAWEHHACAVAGRNFTREEWQRFVGGHSYSVVCR